MTNDGLIHLVGLAGAIAGGPSNAGNCRDGKICTAQAGECRYNSKYYTLGMNDAKSWSMPCADDGCSKHCPYLQKRPKPALPEEERRESASGLAMSVARDKAAGDRLKAGKLKDLGLIEDVDEFLA